MNESSDNRPDPAAPGGRARLGRRLVARVGYGAMQLAESGGRDPVPTDRAVAVLRRAVALGVDHIDTAEFYGEGRANELIRRALAPYPADLALVSKVGAVRAHGTLVPAQRPYELRAQVEQNLRTLGCERLAVVNLRRVDGPTGIVAEGEQVVALDDQLAEMVALRDEGLIEAFGLSSVRTEQVRAAVPAGPVCVQNVDNLLERAPADLRALCVANGLAWVPFFPLGSAFPGRRTVVAEPVVREVADSLHATPAQVGLAWLLAQYPDTLLIPGTSSIEHLEQNVAAGAVDLDDAALDALATLAALAEQAEPGAPDGSTTET